MQQTITLVDLVNRFILERGMSNCISIRDESVSFTQKDMDLDRLMAALRAHRECKGSEVHGGWRQHEPEEWACSMAQWFLVDGINLEVHWGGAQMDVMSVKVRFGRGKSSHTWRDFQSTVLFLDQFMKRTKSHVFRIRDDDWGGGGMSRSTVVFIPGEKKHVFLHDMRQELKRVEAELLKLGV